MSQSLIVFDPKARQIRGDELNQGLDALLIRPDCLLWLAIIDPKEGDLQLLRDRFKVHDLTLEDIEMTHQRPKLDQYEAYSFMVAYQVSYDEVSRELRTEEINLIIGKNYVVTVHNSPITCLALLTSRWLQIAEPVPEDTGFLAYRIFDSIVDEYFPVLEGLREALEAMEESLFADVDRNFLQAIFELKRQLLRFRRLVNPLREVCSTLVKRESSPFGPQQVIYFRDIYDHLSRISDSIDTLRELMASTVDLTIDLYLSNSSNRMNVVMRNLTVITTCLMSATLISSIYGMNFRYLPELGWRYGYPLALAMMVGAIGISIGLFKWRKYI